MTSSPTPAVLPDARGVDLTPWGYAPGSYVLTCVDCPKELDLYDRMGQLGSKRSWRCEEHALAARCSTPPTSLRRPALTIPSGCKITAMSPTVAMVEAAERQGYTPYSAREVWIAMHTEAPHIRAYGVEREGVCSCIPGADGEPLGGPCESCSAKLSATPPARTSTTIAAEYGWPTADELEAAGKAPWIGEQPIEQHAKTRRGRKWVPLEAAEAELQFWQRREYERELRVRALEIENGQLRRQLDQHSTALINTHAWLAAALKAASSITNLGAAS